MVRPKFLLKAACIIVMLLGFSYQVTMAEQLVPKEVCLKNQPKACKVRILSYNVHGISPLLNFTSIGAPVRNNVSRSGLMSWLLMDYDFILLQEDFEFQRQIVDEWTYPLIEYGNGPGMKLLPLWLVTLPIKVINFGLQLFDSPGIPFRAPYGSGLTIASPYYSMTPKVEKPKDETPKSQAPKEEVRREPLPDCEGLFDRKSDCFATKGLLRVPVKLPNGAEFDVYNTHLDAGRHEEDRKVRKEQLKFLAKCIKKISKDRAFILGGDFNSYYDNEGMKETYEEDYTNLETYLIDALKLQDSGARPKTNGYWKSRVDYIFYREGAGARIELVRNSGAEDQRFRHPVNRGKTTTLTKKDDDDEEEKEKTKKDRAEEEAKLLSDHPAILAEFNISPSQLPLNSTGEIEDISCEPEYLAAKREDLDVK